MPEPGENETQDEFMHRCIPMVLDDGTAKDNDQAVAICMSKWEKKSEIDNILVRSGEEIKSLGDGRFGGYLVRFTSAEDPDLTGDFFTKDTDFDMDFPGQSTAYWNHGMGVYVGGKEIGGMRKLGKASLKMDEVGIWAEIILQERDEYEKKIAQMARDGMLGWSSGTAGHLVTEEPLGKAWRIKSWPLGKDASLTHRPAEARNTVIPLKSFFSDNTAQTTEGEPEAVKTAASESGKAVVTSILQGEAKMENTPELQALLQEVSVNSAKEAVKLFRESEPAEKSADIKIVKDEAEQPFKDAGEFFMAVKAAAYYPAHFDRRLLPLKATGLNEAIPSQGGFLVPEQTSAAILEKTFNTGALLAQFPRDQVQGNGMIYNVVDESSRADGSRFGGITGYWLAEAATKTASKPKFRQLELKLHKVAALCVATDELLEDASALQAWIMRTVPMELRFKIEDAIINGSGAGMPLGILNSPALVTFARIDASEIDAVDIGKMWGRRYAGASDYIWLGNQGIFSQLLNLVVGTTPVFLPAGGLSGLPYATLLGRPYFDSEYLPVLGDIGDLLLVSPSAYPMIEKAGGVQAASSIHVYFTSDETAFRFVYRIDGAPSWISALTGNDGVTYSPFVALTSSS
jgi:HK97 family phage major capsid protein